MAELTEALRSPDPVLRDELALTVLADLVPTLDPGLRQVLGASMEARFQDPEIQARTLAPLILAELVRHGEFQPSWLAAFEAWYPAETDLRGYDQELGWLHAVAHGADLLGVFGRCAHVDPASMLRLAAERLLAPTGFVLRDQEDDRLGYALALTSTRLELTAWPGGGMGLLVAALALAALLLLWWLPRLRLPLCDPAWHRPAGTLC